MKYIALIRGVNVGGKSTVKMSELKEAFESAGFTQVLTYINSGNVIFESDQKDIKKIADEIDFLLDDKFFSIKIVVLSCEDLKKYLKIFQKVGKQKICESILHLLNHQQNQKML